MMKNQVNKKRTLIIATAGKTIPLTITAVKVGATAIIAIKGSIYQWTTASSANVEKLLNEFKTAGATKAELKVNSGGGDVFEAEEIKILINDTFGKENVTVKVGAVAASAATRFLSEYYSIAKKNSKIMIHKPMGNPSGNEDEIEGQLKLIKSITQDYKTGYATKMSKTDEDIEQMWAKGDYWMNAQEAKDLGLIDEIEDEEEQIDASNRMLLVACGAPNIPEIVNTKTKIKRMELSVLAVQLGLPSTATQADVDAKI
jgi:ATP-dependent Clp protease protease subunit